MAVAVGREFDPNKKYKVVLSERLKSQSVIKDVTVSSVLGDLQTFHLHAV